MHSSINNQDARFQLSMFAAIMEKGSGLLALSEKGSGKLVYMNEAGMQMLGSTDPAVLEELMAQNRLGIAEAPGEDREWRNKDGQKRWGYYESILFRHEGQEYCFSRLADSSPNSYYQMLEASKEELTAALGKEKELSELKSRFVSLASHEFRTPLSTILSSAFLVKQYGAEEDQAKRDKHLQRIVSSVNLLTDILNDFLSVGKIEEGKIQVRNINFDIETLFHNVIQEMQGIIKEQQEIDYRHSGVREVALDPSLLKHIVMNLLGNAIKFSGSEATIRVRTYREDGQFRLVVADDGIGMSAEDQQHLYERFYRGANVSNIQGTGLGLHIVSKYSELMNGRITCESDLGKGTTFTVIFPLNNETVYQ
jgi:signal transduction histidine kinase